MTTKPTRIITFNRCMQLSAGLLLGLIVALSSVGLLALAGWLICACAVAGLSHTTAMYFNYLIPAAGIRFFALLRIGSRYAERVVSHDVTFRILADLRVWFFRKFEPLIPSKSIQYRSGDLLSRITNDIDALDQIYLRILSPFLVSLILSVVIFFFFSNFSHRIAWVVLIGMLLVIFISCLFFGWASRSISKQLVVTKASYRITVLDFIQGMKEILIFAAKERMLEKLKSIEQKYIRYQKRMYYLKGISISLVTLISGLIIWSALYLGIPLVNQHVITGAVLCMMILAILACFEVLSPLPNAFQYLGSSLIASNRLQEIAKTKPEITYPIISKQIAKSFDIEIQNVSFGYHSQCQILKNIKLYIPYQSKIVITGPSGIGKSSFLQLLARFFDPNEGVIKIGGVDIKQIGEEVLRQQITYISQQDYIFNTTIKENLLIADPNTDDDKIWQVLEAVNLADTIRNTRKGLATQMGEYGQAFSAGQIKRLSLARALLRESSIILLDEPTEGLDKETALLVWKLVLELFQKQTVIIVTHQLEQLAVLKNIDIRLQSTASNKGIAFYQLVN